MLSGFGSVETSSFLSRFHLVRSLAGAVEYREMKQSSLTGLSQAEVGAREVRGILAEIDAELSALERTKDRLKVFRETDRKNRTLRYVLADMVNTRQPFFDLDVRTDFSPRLKPPWQRRLARSRSRRRRPRRNSWTSSVGMSH